MVRLKRSTTRKKGFNEGYLTKVNIIPIMNIIYFKFQMFILKPH